VEARRAEREEEAGRVREGEWVEMEKERTLLLDALDISAEETRALEERLAALQVLLSLSHTHTRPLSLYRM